MVTMSEKTDTYTELCQPYTILGWIEAWNLVHRDADLEDLQILLHRTADLARADEQLNANSKFGSTVKNLTTSFSLICMNSFKFTKWCCRHFLKWRYFETLPQPSSLRKILMLRQQIKTAKSIMYS